MWNTPPQSCLLPTAGRQRTMPVQPVPQPEPGAWRSKPVSIDATRKSIFLVELLILFTVSTSKKKSLNMNQCNKLISRQTNVAPLNKLYQAAGFLAGLTFSHLRSSETLNISTSVSLNRSESIKPVRFLQLSMKYSVLFNSREKRQQLDLILWFFHISSATRATWAEISLDLDEICSMQT